MFGSSNRKRHVQSSLSSKSIVSTLGANPYITTETDFLQLYLNFTKIRTTNIETYNKLSINNVVYTSTMANTTKNIDYCFIKKSGRIGIILCFFKYQDEY